VGANIFFSVFIAQVKTRGKERQKYKKSHEISHLIT